MARLTLYRLDSCGFLLFFFSSFFSFFFFCLLRSSLSFSSFLCQCDSYRYLTMCTFLSGQLLKHHVVPGAVQSSALQNNGAMQSLLSTPLRVKFYESEDNEWRPLKVNAPVHLLSTRKDFFFFFGSVWALSCLCGLRSSRPVFIHFIRLRPR